jgi:uncharacterized protein YegL
MKASTARVMALFFLIGLRSTVILAQAPFQPPPLPLQHVVFVIDNSGSMEGPNGSDPLRLRGVAASLVLDAVELSSNVEAGLIFFDSRATIEAKLGPTDDVRRKLQGGRLPATGGGTNMAAGIEQALTMLSGSKADVRRIVLISDGVPDDPNTVLNQLVPHATAAGVQIFALGLNQVDKNFLDAVSVPTGGKTLVADHHTKLLQSAKELVGNLDNIYSIVPKESLASTTVERQFTIPTGVDRARLTLILDQPTEFAPGEIEFTLDGPVGFSEQNYTIEPSGSANRVAAWTAFFSTAGTYTLRVKVNKAGVAGHRGLQMFVEALSTLRVQLVPNPKSAQYLFDQTVGVLVEAATASGPVNPAEATVTGEVRTASGGSTPITFTAMNGTFNVPSVGGKQAVIVRVRTPLSSAEARFEFRAVPKEPGTLKATPDKFAFAPPLGPANPDVAESLKVFVEFPQGTPHRPVRVSFTWIVPAGLSELTASGAVVKPPPAQYTVPAGGLELKLRVRMDGTKPLPKAGKYPGEIHVTTTEATELTIPFELEVSTPQFVLRDQPKAFALWWDPARERVVPLGSLHSNLSARSTFTVTMPEAMHDPKLGKIAELKLRAGDAVLESEAVEAGKLRYGPVDFPPGEDLPLALVVTPDRDSGWQKQPTTRDLQIRIVSDLGMSIEAKVVFRNPGQAQLPLLEARPLHGLPMTGLALFLLGGFIILLRTWGGVTEVLRFWKYRPGSLLRLDAGPFMIGSGEAAGAALLLPNHGSELDDRTLGVVSIVGQQQIIENTSGYLDFDAPKRLAPGDVVGVKNPEDETEEERPWEIEYIQYEPGVGGEVEVRTSPGMTLGRMLKGLVISVVVLWVVHAALQTSPIARLAYRIPGIESLYTR